MAEYRKGKIIEPMKKTVKKVEIEKIEEAGKKDEKSSNKK